MPYTLAERGDGSTGPPLTTSRIVSLACRPGRLVVRDVYKIITDYERWMDLVLGYNHASIGTVGSNPTPVRRCPLELPRFEAAPVKGETSKSEIEAALRSKEVNCKNSEPWHLYENPNPFGVLKASSWYSDTCQFDFAGCKGLNKPGVTEYRPTKPFISGNPRCPRILLAKFEVQEA